MELKELLTALSKAQAEYPEIARTRKGQIQNRTFMYADLADIHKAIKPVNKKYDLALSHSSDDTHLVSTIYHATSGQSLSTKLPLYLNEQLKETGATMTYLKRYNIQNLLDISTDEDLDAVEKTKGDKKPGDVKPPAQPVKPQSSEPPTQKGPITEPQRTRLFAIAGAKQWTKDQVSFYMKAAWNLESTKDLDRTKYDILVAVIENKTYVSAIKDFHENNNNN